MTAICKWDFRVQFYIISVRLSKESQSFLTNQKSKVQQQKPYFIQQESQVYMDPMILRQKPLIVAAQYGPSATKPK